jgi:hypothetical protein
MLGMSLTPAPAGAAALDPNLVATDLPRIEPAPEHDESAIPRWRRPSLMEARRSDPGRSGVHEPIRFGDAVAPADRRVVRYDLARITAEPDEMGGREVGVLGRGDEVLVVEHQGAYLRITTPDGLEGWVHRTILGRGPSPEAPAAQLLPPDPA